MGIAAGILGGTTTMLARNATRKVIHRQLGSPRARSLGGRGVLTVLLWAAAAGVIFAVADVLLEQRKISSQRR